MEKSLQALIIDAVEEYLDGEEGYGDNVMVEIDPVSKAAGLNDSADVEGFDSDNGKVFVPVMDLVKMSLETPGEWVVDSDAVDAIIDEL